MKVIISKIKNGSGNCTVTREKSDPKFYDSNWGDGESRLLYHVKKALAKQGYNFIKKRMWKDGHLVDERQQYLRENRPVNGRQLCIYSQRWAIEGAEKDFNNKGETKLTVFNLL